MADDTWEPDGHQQARLQFISSWKDRFPADRLQSLSMCWANMKFMGCRYPTKVEKLVNDLESKTNFITNPPKRKTAEKIDFKPASSQPSDSTTSLIDNFVIYEAGSQNPVSILHESAQKSKKSLSFEEKPSSKNGLRVCTVFIEKQVIAVGEAANKKDAKRIAAEKAVEVLRSCQPVNNKKRKLDHNSTSNANKTEFTNQACGETDLKPSSTQPSKPTTTLINNFVIYEADDEDDPQNAVSVLYESAQKSKKSLLFEEKPSKNGFRVCTVFIEKQVIATGEAVNKKDAKRLAAEKAMELLRSCQPVVKKRKVDHDAATTVTKTELTKQAYDNASAIPESNLGNQLLRKMGWTGGGVGKKGQGISEPIMVTGVDGKLGLGQSNLHDINKETIKKVLVDFLSGPEMDLRFSNQLKKEDRALIHKISGELGLRHHSYSTGEDRYLLVSKKERPMS